MTDLRAPLRIAYLEPQRGLTVVQQPPPPSAASCSLTYVGPAGWAFDRSGHEGAARLVNQLVTSAAGPYGRVELARRLDRAGATLGRQCDPESAEVTIWGPAELWEELLRLLALVVQRPRFDPEDVERARRQLAERQLREATQPGLRAERELLARMFPAGHPYAGTGVGSRRSLPRLTREALRRFHAFHYTSEEAFLAVTAPVPPRALLRAVRRHFDEFETPQAPARPSVAARPSARATERVDLPGRSQVEVRFGGPSIPRSDAAFPAAYLANEILGGRPLLSRLFQRVRERGGLAYHASSGLDAMRWGGYWVAQAGTGADRWSKVVPMLRRELERLRAAPPSAGELTVVRESAIGALMLSLESTSDAHELAVDAAYHRLAPDHWLAWPSQLRGVRPAEVREAARRAFDAAGEVSVVVGPLGRTAP